jgi:hypothetical protein
MSTQRILQLLISFGILTLIAFLSEKSRVIASTVAVMPLNVTIALWFVANSPENDAALAAEFTRMMLIGLVPTVLFIVTCWFGFRQGWSLARVLALGYGVWLVGTLIYRGIEWWLTAR